MCRLDASDRVGSASRLGASDRVERVSRLGASDRVESERECERPTGIPAAQMKRERERKRDRLGYQRLKCSERASA